MEPNTLNFSEAFNNPYGIDFHQFQPNSYSCNDIDLCKSHLYGGFRSYRDSLLVAQGKQVLGSTGDPRDGRN